VLHLENCIFSGDTLSAGWLSVLNPEIIISKMHIATSEPTTIEENAFNDTNFRNMNYLTLEGKIVQLTKKCFGGLNSLQTLELRIEASVLSVAEHILDDVPNLLTLQVQSEINDEHFNTLLRDTTLHNLQTLDIRQNNIKELKSSTFRGLTNLLTLEAMHSCLTYIESDIFASSASKIQKVNFAENELETLPVDIFNLKPSRTNFTVYLNKNRLKTLPEGIFEMAIENSDTVEVHLASNDWICDCRLAWLRQYIDLKKIIVKDEPVCVSPETNKNKTFIHADFSNCITTSPPSTAVPSTPPTTTPEATTSSTTKTTTTDTTTPSTMENTTDSTSPPSETMTTDASSTENATAGSTSSTTEIMTTDASSTENATAGSTSTTETMTTDKSSTQETTLTTMETTSDITTPTTEDGYTDVECICNEGYTKNIRILTETISVKSSSMKIHGIKNFKIEEDDTDKKIEVTINAPNHVLIWMNSSDSNSTDCKYKSFTTRAARSSYSYIESFYTAPSTSYTICAAPTLSQEVTVSPLNCRAYTTLPSPGNRAWLLIKEKDNIVVIICFVLLGTVIVGGATIYSVVQHNPELLKGNKRVIVVNHHEGDVILVMPDDHSDTDTPRTSQISRGSVTISEASYVTAIEPTKVQLVAWKFKQMCEKLKKIKTGSKTVPPAQRDSSPLPPDWVPYPSPRSSVTVPNSETNYVTIIEPATVRLMVWMFNQMCEELIEDANESYS
jgi:hypothetical protein